MEITNNSSLTDVKQFLNSNYKEGCYCPACNQRVQLYKRKMASTMAFCLIQFVVHQRNNNNMPFKFSDILDQKNITPSRRADWQKLAYFNLIKAIPSKPAHYVVDQSGFDFVQDRIKMPKYCNVMNKKVYGYSMELVSIKQALTTKFDIDDLLNGN